VFLSLIYLPFSFGRMGLSPLPFLDLHMNFRIRKKTRGFGLLEVILVFAIVIGAAAVVFTVFQSAKPSADAANEVDHATLIASNIKSVLGTYGTNNYVGLNTTQAIASKAIPASMISADGTTINSTWGPITVDFDGGNGTGLCATSGHCFDVAFYKVPANACFKFVVGMKNFYPDGVKVGNVNVVDATNKIIPDTLNTQCDVDNVTVLGISH
jgi:type II secretory pathway pseudopilin PulG